MPCIFRSAWPPNGTLDSAMRTRSMVRRRVAASCLGDLALPVSATDIRHAFATGDASHEPMDEIVPDAVLDYIRSHNLYRS